MAWWLWVLLIGFGLIGATVVAEMAVGSWLGKAIKEGIDSWSKF